MAQEFVGEPSVLVPIDVPGGVVDLAGCAGARVVSGQIVDRPIVGDPTRALDEFLSSPTAETFVPDGYRPVVTSDDAITYGTKVDDRFVTLIVVQKVPAGWQATEWWASAC